MLSLRQINFAQAYPQAPIKNEMYTELPKGIGTHHGSSKDHVLMLLSSMVKSKQVVSGPPTYLKSFLAKGPNLLI
jgi:hypothetical protein